MKIIFKQLFYPNTLHICYLMSKSTVVKPPFSEPLQRVLCLIFTFFLFQITFFCILYKRSIVLLWNLAPNVHCLMRRNFQVFYFDNTFPNVFFLPKIFFTRKMITKYFHGFGIKINKFHFTECHMNPIQNTDTLNFTFSLNRF